MKPIIDQQLFLSVRDFFIQLMENKNIDDININDISNFISDLKNQETFLNEQGVYDETEFLDVIENNFKKSGLSQIFSDDEQEASKIIKEIFSNKTRFSDSNVDNIKNYIKNYYREPNIDTLLKAGESLLENNDFSKNNFPNTSKYILDLSSKVEAHKLKEGLGIIYSVVLKDENKEGEEALQKGKKNFFEFINENIIGSHEPVFYYNENSQDVDVNLCSHRSVFDAFLRNNQGDYSILIATHSNNTKSENETAFTQPFSALYLIQQIENNLLPIKENNFSSIQPMIDTLKESHSNRINFINKQVEELTTLYSILEEQRQLPASKKGLPKGQLLMTINDNTLFDEVVEKLESEDRPGPRFILENHIKRKGNLGTLLSKPLSEQYVKHVSNSIQELFTEKQKLSQELTNTKDLVANNLIDFSDTKNTNRFIENNLSFLKHFIPDELKDTNKKLNSFRSIVHFLDNNTDAIVRSLDINHEKDAYGNIVLKKESMNDIVNLFEKNKLTVRFYGRNQGKNNHAYLNPEEQKQVSKETASYALGQYTYMDYLTSGKNGVKSDFNAAVSYIENILLKNTITETNVNKGHNKETKVISHQLINDPKYTRNILNNILKTYLFEPEKDKLSNLYNKNNQSPEKLDEVTLGYISSIMEGFWTHLSNKIDKNSSLKSINQSYFEFCGEYNIKVTKPIDKVISEQLEIQNAPTNNKARNTTIIAELKHLQQTIENAKLKSIFEEKDKKEIQKMMQIGLPKEQIKALKDGMPEERFENIFLELENLEKDKKRNKKYSN